MADGLTTLSAMVMAATATSAGPDATQRAQRLLGGAGFEVDAAVGPTFAITGPKDLFERFFDVTLEPDGRGGIHLAGSAGRAGYEIPATSVPASLRGDVAIVTFTPPPDFGPGNP